MCIFKGLKAKCALPYGLKEVLRVGVQHLSVPLQGKTCRLPTWAPHTKNVTWGLIPQAPVSLQSPTPLNRWQFESPRDERCHLNVNIPFLLSIPPPTECLHRLSAFPARLQQPGLFLVGINCHPVINPFPQSAGDWSSHCAKKSFSDHL